MGSIGILGTRVVFDIKIIEVSTGLTISTAYDAYDSIDKLLDEITSIVLKLSKIE